MNTMMIFQFQFLCSLFMFGLVANWYIWPRLVSVTQIQALTPLLLYSAFRYTGTFFLVPSMSNGLAPEWGGPAAYLDILSAGVALIGAFLGRSNNKAAVLVAWAYV